jgi:hypothetical protein
MAVVKCGATTNHRALQRSVSTTALTARRSRRHARVPSGVWAYGGMARAQGPRALARPRAVRLRPPAPLSEGFVAPTLRQARRRGCARRRVPSRPAPRRAPRARCAGRMGATSSIVTGKMDLVKKGLSYDTLCVPRVPPVLVRQPPPERRRVHARSRPPRCALQPAAPRDCRRQVADAHQAPAPVPQ